MGYLNNQVVTVDAILTKKGRELLAKGDGSFKITQFALADDEIDYTLYNPNHPSGSAYYGEAIENMPLLEAFPDENQMMKYKLTTLPRGTAKMPVLSLGYSNITLKQGAEITIQPKTLNYLGSTTGQSEGSGYTAMISDVRLFSTIAGSGIATPAASAMNTTETFGTNVSKTVMGTVFTLTATTINTLFTSQTARYATLIITGRDSGARIQIPITITQSK
jgi:hypothetical protein